MIFSRKSISVRFAEIWMRKRCFPERESTFFVGEVVRNSGREKFSGFERLWFGCGAMFPPEIEGGCDEEIEEGGGEEAADDDGGDGVEDFAAGDISLEDERDECDARGEGGHEDGDEAFVGAAEDEGFGEGDFFYEFEVAEMGEQHDAISRGDAADGDEADERGEAERDAEEGAEENAADHGEGEIEEDLGDERPRGKIAVEEEGDGELGEGGEPEDACAGALLGLEISFDFEGISGREVDGAIDFLLPLGDGLEVVSAVELGGDREGTLLVLAGDLVGAGGGVKRGETVEREPEFGGDLDEMLIELLRGGGSGIFHDDVELAGAVLPAGGVKTCELVRELRLKLLRGETVSGEFFGFRGNLPLWNGRLRAESDA